MAPADLSEHTRQQLPDGPGKELLPRLCGGCHDLTFTVSTRETEEGWTRIVNDMRSKGADGTEEEFAKVIAYLTANMGKPGAPVGQANLELIANRIARVTYQVGRETCLTETATASMTLPVGDGGMPSHEEEFARAGVTARPPR